MSGLRSDLQPMGALEDTLVEKLATLFWRYQRLIRVEAGEIQRNIEFVAWDENDRQTEDANQIVEGDSARNEPFSDTRSGLIRHIANPIVLRRCIELLREFQTDLKDRGFEEEADTELLNKLYGQEEHPFKTLKEEYDIWSNTANASPEDRQAEGYATPEECLDNVLDLVKAEITLVEHDRKQTEVNSAKIELNRTRYAIPRSPDMDRFLRYEAIIERAIDRTLSQLERRQRIRKGQAMIADVNVNLND